MTDIQNSFPAIQIEVSRPLLKQALDAMDVSDSALSKDGGSLFCRDSLFIVRQGYTERSIPCNKPFQGQFSISFTSLKNWKRAQKAGAGDESLTVADGQLTVCGIAIPAKWQREIESLAHVAPRFVAPESLQRMAEPIEHAVPLIEAKTCVAFRVNANRQELAEALRTFAITGPRDVHLRTWGGKLILNDGRQEIRVDAEGKIDGFSLIPASSLYAFTEVAINEERFTNVICEKHEIKILGKRVKTPRKALRLSDN